MTSVSKPPYVDDFIRLYESGQSFQKIASQFPVSWATVRRRLIAAGVSIRNGKDAPRKLTVTPAFMDGVRRGSAKNRIQIPGIDGLIQRYTDGESEQALAREAGVSRHTFRARLLERGIEPRGASEANALRMQSMTKQERSKLAKAAHDALRGKKRPESELHQRAIARQETLQYQSPAERVFIAMLERAGVVGLTPQKAVGRYNVDIAVEEPRIAVEIEGHRRETRLRNIPSGYNKRTKYLLNRGWHVLIIRVDGVRHFLTDGARDYLIALIDELRSDKSGGCQYRVISGNGDPMPIRSLKSNRRTAVESP